MSIRSFIGLHQLVISNFNVRKIISFDVADGAWGSLKLPFVEKSVLI